MATLKNVSVSEFKSIEDVELVQIIKNPNTGKLFAATEKDRRFKVQGDIDTTKPVTFLFELSEGAKEPTKEQWEAGCFVNSGNVVASL